MPRKRNRRAGDAAVRQDSKDSPVNTENRRPAQAPSWRAALPVHPAADLFPQMSPDELRELGEDINAHGLRNPIVLWRAPDRTHYLLDGRNRLDAIAATDVIIPDPGHPCSQVTVLSAGTDPYAYVISANVRRRHLNAEQRRDLIARLLKAAPHKSDRQIAETVKMSHHTVGAIRTELQLRGQIAHAETRTDTRGRQQPASKDKRTGPGVGMHPYSKRGLDLYETPPAAVRALLKVEPLDGTVWEPACGPGSIVAVLRDAGLRVIASDIADHKCPNALVGVDFLAQESAPNGAEIIVTNPPFMHADNFVRHALKLVPKVLMLLRLAFLESTGRSDILDGGQLARVYPFANRLPMMHRSGWTGPHASSQMCFAWFVWDRNHRGPAQLQRISWDEDKAPTVATAPPVDDDLSIPGFLRRATP